MHYFPFSLSDRLLDPFHLNTSHPPENAAPAPMLLLLVLILILLLLTLIHELHGLIPSGSTVNIHIPIDVQIVR